MRGLSTYIQVPSFQVLIATVCNLCIYVCLCMFKLSNLLSELYTVHRAVHCAHYHIKSININFASDKYMHG